MSSAREALYQARTYLRLDLDEVERQLGLAAASLASIEEGRAPLDTAMLDGLATFYGLLPADVAQGRPVAAILAPLQSLLEAGDLSAPVRSQVARVAAARRELKRLEHELGKPDRYLILRTFFPHVSKSEWDDGAWKSIMNIIRRVREREELEPYDPMPSMRRLTLGLGIELVEGDLSDPRIAGFSFVDASHGPAIVVNLRGANVSPYVRRWTVARELCHVVQDEKMPQSGVQLYDTRFDGCNDTAPGVDAPQRFADNLLVPDQGVRRLRERMQAQRLPLSRQVQHVMELFGVPFETARRRLRQACGVRAEDIEALKPVSIAAQYLNDWNAAEVVWEDVHFSCRSVPEERRGDYARLVVEAWRKEHIDRRQALDLLQAAPDEALEDLLAFSTE
jgi:Zn-dependent peptidase ImmA (M78 family)